MIKIECYQQVTTSILQYGIASSPFGRCFIGIADGKICQLAFMDSESQQKSMEKAFHAEWVKSEIKQDDDLAAFWISHIFDLTKEKREPITLLLKGTVFQCKVWNALLTIPSGSLVAYQAIAKAIQAPNAVRAAASAIAKNPIAYLVPCHRVIRKNGDMGEYRWNKERKKALIAFETNVIVNPPRI